MSQATTEGIQVRVETHFLPERSDPVQGLWLYVYQVTITNQGEQEVQIISRHWIITNAHGVEEHVRGSGVVGQHPTLAPGQCFQYTSACPLDTPMGTMHGSYELVTQEGRRFDAVIAPFMLAEPHTVN